MSVYYGENKIKAMRKGTQRAIAIYKGSRLIFQEKMAVVADSQHVTLEGLPEFVLFNDPLVVSVAPEEGYALISVQVIMNGEDITSEVYANNTIAIPEVKGGISIAALASPPIVFEDEAVKAICVQNWGGNYIDGEITEHEASLVTSLNNVFKQNTNIIYFKEFRYFTGITDFPTTSVSSFAAGQFYNCTNLLEINMPKIGGAINLSGLFRNANRLKYIDLTPLMKHSIVGISNAFRNAGDLEYATFPHTCTMNNSAYYLFRNCKKLATINFNDTDWTGVTTYTYAFHECPALATITGCPVGFSYDLMFPDSSLLTRESILVIINGLYDFVGHGSATTRNLKLHSTALGRLTEDDIEIATNKGWTVTA